MKYIKEFKEVSVGTENYMVFGNLKNIKRMIEELLSMEESKVDNIIKNGHDWIEDHISVSNENIEQVYNFLINKK